MENKEPYLIGHLKITGNDLIDRGIKGEKIGEILSRLQQKVIEDPTFNTKAKLLNETAAATEDINADGSVDIADLVCLYLYADTYAGYANNSGVTIGSSGSIEVTR